MPPLLISDVARAAGVSPDTLRFYERKGLLPPAARTASGYRTYSASAVERVRIVRRAAAIGFTLDELARVLRARDKGAAPCREVRAIAARKLDEIGRQIQDLTRVKQELESIVRDWDARLARTPAGRQARLLDALGETR